MHLLNFIRDLCIDFLFPRNQKILDLENLTVNDLMNTLPPAETPKAPNTIALFDYNHPTVREIVWEIKYKGNSRLSKKLGVILFDHIKQELDDLNLFGSALWQRDKPILMPIPISDKRRLERGWNQAELLAKHIIENDQGGIFRYLPKQLEKVRHTESQIKTRSKKERLENLTDSMAVKNPREISGKCVVLIDDVTTTGATFAEARRALEAGGAKHVICVALAH